MTASSRFHTLTVITPNNDLVASVELNAVWAAVVLDMMEKKKLLILHMKPNSTTLRLVTLPTTVPAQPSIQWVLFFLRG